MAGSTVTQVRKQGVRGRVLPVKTRQCDESTSPAVLRAEFQFHVLKTLLFLPTAVINNKLILHLPPGLALPAEYRARLLPAWATSQALFRRWQVCPPHSFGTRGDCGSTVQWFRHWVPQIS